MHTRIKIWAIALVTSLTACSQEPSLTEKFEQKKQTISCAELGSIECVVRKIVKADDKATWYKFGDRKILFECKGTIKAGIDLSSPCSIQADINEENKSITLTLPAAKILSLNLNPEDTKLVYEKVSLTRFDFKSVERNALLKQGEASILEDFQKENSILKEAEKNCASFFSTMLRQVGFININVNFKE
ncbi:MAG: DUF4230 domain-containing protein [Paludibacteraceae bacterium]|nr:DUF4230 domain-containing protein [Paludibacteraceae bacterium]